MSELPKQVSLKAGGINRDYLSIYKDLESLIPHFTKEWTYHGDNDVGITLLQLFSYLADHLHYRADGVFRDSRAATTEDRFILEKLSEWLGYHAVRPSAALADMVFTIDRPLAVEYRLPIGTQVKAAASLLDSNDTQEIIFEILQEVVFPIGATIVTGTVVQGESQVVELGAAVGDRFEAFTLTDTNIIFNRSPNDLTVRVNGERATFKPFFALTAPNELAYMVRVLRGGSLEILFGDGSFGKRLSPGDFITVEYRLGGGEIGLVGRNAITEVLGTFTAQGLPLTVTCTNPAPSIGGNEAESDASIRLRAPAYFATQDRAVTLADYKVRTEIIPGVRECQPVRVGVNGVLLHILPTNPSEEFILTDAFVRRILLSLQPYQMATDTLSVSSAKVVSIDVELECFAFASQANSVVRRRVLEAFLGEDGLLNSRSNSLGQHLRQSDMIGTIEDVEGVDYLNVLRYARRPTLDFKIKNGNAKLSANGIQINSDTVDEIFTITFTTATTYNVSGSVSGFQTPNLGGLGTLGELYTPKSNIGRVMCNFVIEAGDVPMQPGDRAEIVLSALKTNIQLREGEFPVAGEIKVTVQGGIE